MTIETIEYIGSSVFEERDINPSQLGVASKQINAWIKDKSVPFVSAQNEASVESSTGLPKSVSRKKAKSRWVKLNLAQAVWVSIVNELINFKVPSDQLAELAKIIWQKPREDKYADEVFEYHIKENPHSLTKHVVDKLKGHLRNEVLMERYFRTIINPFTDMVKSAFYRNKLPHNFLYVPETNDYVFHYNSKELILQLNSVYLQNSMISIPIVPILSKILLVEFDNKKNKNLKYLTNVEKQIRDIVVFKRPKTVEIAFEEGNITPIVVTEEHKSREQFAEYILRNKIKKGSKLLIDIRSDDHYKITLIKKEN